MLTACNTRQMSSCTIGRRRCWQNPRSFCKPDLGSVKVACPKCIWDDGPDAICTTKRIRNHEDADGFPDIVPNMSWTTFLGSSVLAPSQANALHCLWICVIIIMCFPWYCLVFDDIIVRMWKSWVCTGTLEKHPCFGCQNGSCKLGVLRPSLKIVTNSGWLVAISCWFRAD